MTGPDIEALQIACKQQPTIGQALDIGFDIFEVSPPATSSTPKPSPDDDGDSNKVKIGVGVGVGVGGSAIVILVGAWFCWRRRRRHDIGHMPGSMTQRDYGSGPADREGAVNVRVYEAPNNKPNTPELGPGGRWDAHELDAR